MPVCEDASSVARTMYGSIDRFHFKVCMHQDSKKIFKPAIEFLNKARDWDCNITCKCENN